MISQRTARRRRLDRQCQAVESPFLFLPGAPVVTGRVDPAAFSPADRSDIAVLRLDDVPAGASVLPLGSAADCRGHRVSVFGAPDGGRYGYAYAGDLLPDLEGKGQRLQLTGANDITVGYSGSPVIDDLTGLAVGMVREFSSVDKHSRGSGVAYATPAQTLWQTDSTLVESAVCPYRGLAPFDAEHRRWFHGRADAVQQIVRALGQRAVLVLGPSGSGKSSLLNAGVLPQVVPDPDRPGADGWTAITARPGQDLLAELDRAGLTGASAEGLGPAVRSRLASVPAGSRLLLVIDQFEEVFTRPETADPGADPSGALSLLGDLSLLIREPLALTVVLVMRDDFYAPLAAMAPDLFQALSRCLVNIPATLTRTDVEAIIKSPADSVGLHFEEGLVGRIVRDLESAGNDTVGRNIPVTVLPLLELALLQLWAGRVNGRLTHSGYERIGEVVGSLTRRCDRVIADLGVDREAIARRLLTALVRPADPGRDIAPARRQMQLGKLKELAVDHTGHDIAAVDDVLRSLTTGTPLITTHDRADAMNGARAPVAELIHDSLIRDWTTLRRWVDEDSRFHDWLDRAERQRDRWRSKKDNGDLLNGSDLAEGLTWSGRRRLPTDVADFLAASTSAAEARARRTRTAIATMAALLVLAVGGAITATAQWQEALRAKGIALSRQLAAQSQILASGNPDLSALLAVHAFRLNPTREALTSLYSAASATRPLRHTLAGHTQRVYSVAFGRGGSTLATGSGDGTVRLWNAGETVLSGPSTAIYSVAFNRDGRTVAAGTGDGKIWLWDATTGERKTILSGHRGAVRSVAFSRNGKWLASGGSDGTVRLWSVTGETGKTLFAGRAGAVWSVAFSPDGQTVAAAVADGTARLWRVATGGGRVVLKGHTSAVCSVAFSPNGKTLATGSADETARLWDVATGTTFSLTGHADTVWSVAFSPDGRTLATGSGDGTARLWDIATRTTMRTLRGHTNAVYALAFSPDGTTLATGGGDNSVRVWDTRTGRSTATLTGHTAAVRSLAFSPDGATLATGSVDSTVRLWDVATGIGKATLTGHSGTVYAATFSPDGKTLATGGADRTARLWGTATPQPATAIDNVCAAIGHDMTDGEYAVYLPDQPRERAC